MATGNTDWDGLGSARAAAAVVAEGVAAVAAATVAVAAATVAPPAQGAGEGGEA